MLFRRSRPYAAITSLVIVLLSLVIAGAASAQSNTYTADLVESPVWMRFNSDTCEPIEDEPEAPVRASEFGFYYHAQPFYVGAAGNYTFSINAPFDEFAPAYGVYENRFRPSNSKHNCLGARPNDSMTLSLVPDTQYIIVVTSMEPFDTGTFEMTVDGPGSIVFSTIPSPEPVDYIDEGGPDTSFFDPGDDRINAQAYANVAVYCDDANSRLAIYPVLRSSTQGSLPLFVAYAELLPTPIAEQGNLLIAQSGNISLYRLTSGELSVIAGPDWEGKSYAVIFDKCQPTYVNSYVYQNGVMTPTEAN